MGQAISIEVTVNESCHSVDCELRVGTLGREMPVLEVIVSLMISCIGKQTKSKL